MLGIDERQTAKRSEQESCPRHEGGVRGWPRWSLFGRRWRLLLAGWAATFVAGCVELKMECDNDEKPCPSGQACVMVDGNPPRCFHICRYTRNCDAPLGCVDEICQAVSQVCDPSVYPPDCPEGFHCPAVAGGSCVRMPAGYPTCTDGARTGSETDIDCGGSCPPCAAGQGCGQGTDCQSGICDAGGLCSEASCEDEWQNATETDVDCGGDCPPCENGQSCIVGTDCQSGDCAADEDDVLACNICGDEKVRGSEGCDDGNTILEECTYHPDYVACQVCGPICQTVIGVPNYCGDGNIDAQAGEQCDDGDGINSNAWSPVEHCKLDCSGPAPFCGDGIFQGNAEDCGEPGAPECGATEECAACQCVTAPPAAPVLSVAYGIKELRFSWSGVLGASYYRLYEDPDGLSGFAQLGPDLDGVSYEHGVVLWQRADAVYQLEACNAIGCTPSQPLQLEPGLVSAIGYFKASNTEAHHYFGGSVALSADGSTLAVGAVGEDSAATGVNGDQADNSGAEAGAVYVFARQGGAWIQQAYVKASNTEPYDGFGHSVALSADGSTLAVGASLEESAATGADGDQTDNSAVGSGAVYVFTRQGGHWSQQAYLKASNTGETDRFGTSVVLSADGSTLAVGAAAEDSAATGVGGDQADNSARNAGAVYVFARQGDAWAQQAYVKASNTQADDRFGSKLALSADGSTLAVGAASEDSAATGVGGNQANNGAYKSGAVYVFTRQGGVWSQQAYVKATNTQAYDSFGSSVALSADGSTLAVGANGESSAATGVGGDQADNSAYQSGAVYVFTREADAWSQQAYVKASNTEAGDFFGCVSLSADGDTLAVSTSSEDSAATGVGGDQADNSLSAAGAVYLFARQGGLWSQQVYVKASNTGANDRFGGSVALSADGSALAVGAEREGSAAFGVGGDQADNSAEDAGAVYLY